MAFSALWIVAGPNGAGKTTCVQKKPICDLLPGVPFLNPDDRTLVKLREAGYLGFRDAPIEVQTGLFYESADEVLAELEEANRLGQSIGVETVLSSSKYLPLVESLHAKGGFVGLIYVAVSSPSISQQRVAARVRLGGHGIPDDKIAQRWKRSLQLLPLFARFATSFWVVDNSNSDPIRALPLIAMGRFGQLEYVANDAFDEMKSAMDAIGR